MKKKTMKKFIVPQSLVGIVNKITALRGQVFLVGGAVRDLFLNKEPEDLDIEVFGITAEQLNSILGLEKPSIGKSFEIIAFKTACGLELDFSFPLTQDLKDACARRDFTINGMMLNLATGEVLDFFNGQEDLKNKILRPISELFKTSFNRPLRAMRFIPRLGFESSLELVSVCSEMNCDFEKNAPEQLFLEFEKMFLQTDRPSKGLVFLKEIGWNSKFPDLRLEGILKTTNILTSVDLAGMLSTQNNLSKDGRLVLMFSAMMIETLNPKGFLKQMGAMNQNLQMGVLQLLELREFKTITDASVRKMLSKLTKVSKDVAILFFSAMRKDVNFITKLVTVIDAVKDQVQPFVMGQDLLDLGFKAGKEMGIKLKELFEIQLETGKSKDELLNLI